MLLVTLPLTLLLSSGSTTVLPTTAEKPLLQQQAEKQKSDHAGWITIKLKGAPREIGFQYGAQLADQIADAHKAVRVMMQRSTGKSWSYFRKVATEKFWSHLDKEYQEEIMGQAEGLKSRGVELDWQDVLAFNAHIEIEGYYIPWLNGQPSTKQACSAFVAVGSSTKDGKVVMGHNLWWDYVVGPRFNLVLDISPAKGNRVVMDALPGFIHSGSDFAFNSAGLMLCETTISGFMGFDPNGIPEFMRMRKAIQYGSNMSQMVEIFKKGNNGGYANAWLMADRKTNSIGKLQLGLKNVIFDQKADGYFVGSNFAEDPKLMAEETNYVPSPSEGCEIRRRRWYSLLDANKGSVDVEKAKNFLADTLDEASGRVGASGSTLCGRIDFALHGAVNTKVIDSQMCEAMTFWGRMGFSDGSAYKVPSQFQPRSGSPLAGILRDITPSPWVKL